MSCHSSGGFAEILDFEYEWKDHLRNRWGIFMGSVVGAVLVIYTNAAAFVSGQAFTDYESSITSPYSESYEKYLAVFVFISVVFGALSIIDDIALMVYSLPCFSLSLERYCFWKFIGCITSLGSFVGVLGLNSMLLKGPSSNDQYYYLLFNIILTCCLAVYNIFMATACYGVDRYYENRRDQEGTCNIDGDRAMTEI